MIKICNKCKRAFKPQLPDTAIDELYFDRELIKDEEDFLRVVNHLDDHEIEVAMRGRDKPTKGSMMFGDRRGYQNLCVRCTNEVPEKTENIIKLIELDGRQNESRDESKN